MLLTPLMRGALGSMRPRLGMILLGVLLAFLLAHGVGACLDFVAASRYPFELDYGEGIVWQQALLIPGPRMYSSSQELPFIVFHYPPLYYFLVHAAAPFMPDMLSAGRLISATSAVLLVPLVAGLVLAATEKPDARRRTVRIVIAVAAGLLVLSLHAVRTWGLLMRVDMPAIALGLAGVLVAARTNGSFRGTTLALLLCLASVYCKQTQLPAGMAIFLVTLVRRPRSALGAATIVLLIGLAALGLLQGVTSGGFLRNIVGDNVNRFSPGSAAGAFLAELRSLPFMTLMLVAAGATLSRLLPSAPADACQGVSGWGVMRLRLADRTAAARAIILLHFAFATLMLLTLFKSGSYINYFLDLFSIGSPLIGILLCDLVDRPRDFGLLTALMIVAVAVQPRQQIPASFPQPMIDAQSTLVRRIAAAEKPIASENMTLLMRAGKAVVFEPAIVTELAALGRWDEMPLLRMIGTQGFAFMITGDDIKGGTNRRSPAVDAAMRAAYPRTEKVGENFWLHLPR